MHDEDDDEELLPEEHEDDGRLEDRDLLLQQLHSLAARPGPLAALLQAGQGWLRGEVSPAVVRNHAADLEADLEDDPLLSSQLDRLEEGLAGNEPDQVLYALLGLVAAGE